MIDTSASMDDLVAAGESKWSAITSAMTTFVNDPASAGIGLGLQYFPLTAAGVPASCTSSAQCGTGGPCLLAICANQQETIPCSTAADCPRRAACVSIGECENDHNYLCQDPGNSQCSPDPNGFALGACQVLTSSTCINGDSCSAQDYATPAVAIAPLPGVAASVISSLSSHQPVGNTPTSAALQGAIDEATTQARANPGHVVVAVLATDGIPDECTPIAIPGIEQIAAAGLAGSPSIKTFTIGVFTPDDVSSGTSALNGIASAGGTGQAFIVNSSTQNVEQQLSAALTAIRGASLPCSYLLPVPDSGAPDFSKLNVQYTPASGTATTVPYVESPSRCTMTGGWYYDVDPAEGGVPSQIVVCPATCSEFQTETGGLVDVVLGCQTVSVLM